MDVRVENHPGFPSDLYVDGELLGKVDPAVGDVVEGLLATIAARLELCAQAWRFLAALATWRRDQQQEFGYLEQPLFANRTFDELLYNLGAAVGQQGDPAAPAPAGRVIENVALAEIRSDGAMRFSWAVAADDPLQGILWMTGQERPIGVQVGARGRLVYQSTGSYGRYVFEQCPNKEEQP